MADTWIIVGADVMMVPDHGRALRFVAHPDQPNHFRAMADHQIPHQTDRQDYGSAQDLRLRIEAVNRWYQHDWNMLDNRGRQGLSAGHNGPLSRSGGGAQRLDAPGTRRLSGLFGGEVLVDGVLKRGLYT